MECERGGFSRRSLLGIALGGALAAGFALPSARSLAAEPAQVRSPDEALAKLKEGNARYINEPELCVQDLAEARSGVVAGQAPWATVLSCADSRVPPKLIFGGRSLGELFVARNAGNLADTATIGTLEYGAAVLGSPVIVVLAHTSCGAVEAACNIVTSNATYPGAIGRMIEPIVPAAIAQQGKEGNYVDNTAMESARRTATGLAATSSLLSDRVNNGTLKIVAAMYDLKSGEVTFET
jgi:carbonic anhydrase